MRIKASRHLACGEIAVEESQARHSSSPISTGGDFETGTQSLVQTCACRPLSTGGLASPASTV